MKLGVGGTVVTYCTRMFSVRLNHWGESDTSGRSDGRHFSPRGNGSGISVFTGESAKRQVNPRAALTTKICVSIVVFKGYKG